MPNITKLLNKVNQAKSAVNSVKGIASKLSNINYASVANSDELLQQAEQAKDLLNSRRESLEKALDASNVAKHKAKKVPCTNFIELMYPIHDELENSIIFTSRPRKNRATGSDDTARKSLLSSDEQVEIQLYVPDEINSTSNVSYEAQGVGAGARAAAEAVNRIGGAQGFMGTIDAIGDSVMAGVTAAMTGLQNMMNNATGNVMFFMQGKAQNPMQEQMLKGVDFRTFTFNYIFYPKSQQEAQMINDIIYYFRTAMLPDTYPAMGGGGDDPSDIEGFFNMPNVWDIQFGGPIADKVDGFLPCVLTKCDVNHTGGLKFSTYYDGQPIKTSISLDFAEIKILTQESYQEITANPKGAESGLKSMDSLLDRQTSDSAFAANQDAAGGAIEQAQNQGGGNG